MAANAVFAGKGAERMEWFRTNPANTLPYRALAALERDCVVHIAEVLHDEHNLHPTTATIRGKDELKLHRDALSHPVTVKWRRKDGQEFFEQHRVWNDLRPAIVWDLQKSINEALLARGQNVHVDDVPVTTEMAATLHLILTSAMNPGMPLPETSEMMQYLQAQRDKYLAILDKHPHGKRTP
jgi:hypothetical protein